MELQILAPWDAHTLGAAPGGSRICNIAVDIALESGFESVPYFNRIFKERYLVTPHRWRKKSIL